MTARKKRNDSATVTLPAPSSARGKRLQELRQCIIAAGPPLLSLEKIEERLGREVGQIAAALKEENKET